MITSFSASKVCQQPALSNISEQLNFKGSILLPPKRAIRHTIINIIDFVNTGEIPMNFCQKHCKDLLIECIKLYSLLSETGWPPQQIKLCTKSRLNSYAKVVAINGNKLCRKIDTNLFMNDWAVFFYTTIVGSTNMGLLYLSIKFCFMESAVNYLS